MLCMFNIFFIMIFDNHFINHYAIEKYTDFNVNLTFIKCVIMNYPSCFMTKRHNVIKNA